MDTNVHEIDTINNTEVPTPSEHTPYPVTNQAHEHCEIQPVNMVSEVCKNIKIEENSSPEPVVKSQEGPHSPQVLLEGPVYLSIKKECDFRVIGEVIIDQETDISDLNKSIGLYQNDTQDTSQNVSPTSVPKNA